MARMQRRLEAAVALGQAPRLRGNSVHIGFPPAKLATAKGEVTAAGREYEAILDRRGGPHPESI